MSKEKKALRQARRKDFWERNKKTHGYLLQKTVKNYGYVVIRALLLFGLCFMILQPLINKLSVSFMVQRDLYDATVISIPRTFTFDNYKLVDYLIDYWKCLGNSLWVSLAISILQVIACTLVGYGFARFKFPFKNFWFACVILVIIVPPQTIMSSLYIRFANFDIFGIIRTITGETANLQSSVLPYFLLSATCMGLKCGLYIYMLRQYFRGIPKELEEAAYVDGCGTLQTFIRIMLPDAKAMITSCFLFAFVWQWTDWFYTKMFLGKVEVLTKGLNSISGRLENYSEMMGGGATVNEAYLQQIISTGTLMAIAPLIILYLFAQKGFVESLSQTGIKM